MLTQPWRILLLGGLQACQPDRTIRRFYSQKTGLLLAYLAMFPNRSHPREALVELLWPESEAGAGRTNLRVALNALRHQLEPPGVPAGAVLIADRTHIGLNPQAIRTDVAELETLFLRERWPKAPRVRADYLTRALSLYQGDLLPGYYEEWVGFERDRLSGAYQELLKDLTVACSEAGDWNRAIDTTLRALALDSLCEATHADLIRLYIQVDRPTDALRQYAALERLYREEMGQRPSRMTRALVEPLLQNGAQPPPYRRSSGANAVVSAFEPAAPLPTGAPTPPQLPLAMTRFFGREEEVAQLHSLWQRPETRLVTLTGAGGVGKTRLAVEFARRYAEQNDARTWFIALAEVTDPEKIVETIAYALHLPALPNGSRLEQVVTFLHSGSAVLVFDNFEQLVQGGALVVHTLLQRLPGLRCLVTSRQPLELTGEQEFPVGTLPTPRNPGNPERLLEFASVQLFVDRAQLGRPSFQITTGNAPVIAALCDHLEGIPLAIELAAAWVPDLSPQQILTRLGQRFNLLVSRKQDLPPRHRTLRAAIEWSCRLLETRLQRLFAQLSVFRGGWTLEAAEAVCEEGVPSEPSCTEAILMALTELRARSLVIAEDTDTGMRYRLLETLREYADEQTDAQARERLAARHADYFLQVADKAHAKLAGADQALWLAVLEADLDNLRTALTWTLAKAPETGLRLAVSLVRFWYFRGYSREGRAWLESLLAASPQHMAVERAKAHSGAGVLAWAQGDYAGARQHHQSSRKLQETLGDRYGQAATLNNLGLLAWSEGDLTAARDAYTACLQLYREMENMPGLATVLSNLGSIALEQGDYPRVRPLLEESLAVSRGRGDRRAEALSLHNLGILAHKEGDYRTAGNLLREGLAIRREVGEKSHMALSFTNLGLLARDMQDWDSLVKHLGTAMALRDAIGSSMSAAEKNEYEAAIAEARTRLGDTDFSAAWTKGQTMALEQAVEDALRDEPVTVSISDRAYLSPALPNWRS